MTWHSRRRDLYSFPPEAGHDSGALVTPRNPAVWGARLRCERIVRRLRYADDLWAIAGVPADPDFPLLVAALGSRSADVRLAARAALREAGDEGFSALIDRVEYLDGYLLTEAVRTLGDWRDARAAPALLRILRRETVAQTRRTIGFVAVFALALALTQTFAWWGILWSPWRSTAETRRVIVEALGKIGDTRAIGPLAHLAHPRWSQLATAAIAALEQLVPAVQAAQPADPPDLGVDGVPALAGLLDDRFGASRQILILRALHVCGDGRALRAVEHCAVAAGDRGVRELAAETAALLAKRVEEAAARATLVRGAAAGPVQDGLLRATGAGKANTGDELLRTTQQ